MRRLFKIVENFVQTTNVLCFNIINFKIFKLIYVNYFLNVIIKKDDFNIYLL